MRVVVTGGGGFIGAAVCMELTERGHDAIIFDRSTGEDVLIDDIPDCDHVIHLAGVLGTDELFDNPHAAVMTNVSGTINVLQRCRDLGAGYTGISMPPVFPSVYTATKLCAIHMAKAWHHTYGVPVSHVRAFNAFGPGQKHGPGHPRKIIPAFASAAWRGEPIIIWGDVEQTVDLIHTRDLAAVLCDAIRYGNDETFDGGTGLALTVNEVAEMVIELADSKSEVQHLPMRRGEAPTKIVATGEGWDRLGWQPRFCTVDLEDTVGWYRP
jgi:UDP-glucose 4-epimerase